MNDQYILKDGQPVVEPSTTRWAEWFEKNTEQRRVGKDEIDDVLVSTVFLGIDHSFGHGAAQIYETMVFGGALDAECVRYATPEQAEIGHAVMVQRVKDAAQGGSA